MLARFVLSCLFLSGSDGFGECLRLLDGMLSDFEHLVLFHTALLWLTTLFECLLGRRALRDGATQSAGNCSAT